MSVRGFPVGRLATAVLAVLLLAGCATVPDHSQAQVVPPPDDTQTSVPAPGPDPDADPLSLVRSFVQASANPAGDHAAARAYLTKQAADRWNPSKDVTVISEPFDTVPGDEPAQPGERTVKLRARGVGILATDGGFRPGVDDFSQTMHLRRQPDGQWRIVDPQPGVVITLSQFLRYYRQVRVYYFDTTFGIPVPDVRYAPIGPADRLAGEVIDLLLAGPSKALSGAVTSAIPPNAVNRGNVTESGDGALLVNLAQLGRQSAEAKQRIAAQLVLSLQSVTNSVIRLQADGEPLFPNHLDWRLGDLPPYDSLTHPAKDLPGLVATGGKLRLLNNGNPVPGPPGTGSARVQSAGQSIDGTRLAVVSRTNRGVELRVGRYGEDLLPVAVHGGTLSRPSWGPGNAASGYEVWTVADKQHVYRVVNRGGGWLVTRVNAGALTAKGPITDLRLSRDGVRAAAVIGGQLVVASVVRNDGTVRLSQPQVLQGGLLTSVVGVAWQDETTLIAATGSSSLPVVKVPVDGLQEDRYDTANLTLPITGVAAAPRRSVVVADADGLWTTPDVAEIWRPGKYSAGKGAVPCYPG